MPDMADDLNDSRMYQRELHLRGKCNKIDCQYCAEMEDNIKEEHMPLLIKLWPLDYKDTNEK